MAADGRLKGQRHEVMVPDVEAHARSNVQAPATVRRRPGRPRSEASREAILAAASALLDEVGCAALTIEGIAARAGAGKRTIYRWWPTKGAIVIEAFLASISPDIVFRTTASARADLKRQLRSVVRTYNGKDGRTVRDLIALGQSDTAMLKDFVDGYIEPRRRLARTVLDRARANGEINQTADLDEVIDGLYGPIFTRLLFRHAPLTENFIERHVEIVLNGLDPSST